MHEDARAAAMAMAACMVMLAAHVGSKAVRDAFFLSQFPVTALPTMVAIAAVVSILSVSVSSRAMTRFTPARLVPSAFAVSAAAQLALWMALDHFPRACAVVFYLQTISLGALLSSGFWSMINEQFDPHRARQLVGRIAGAGTLGGMIGGIVAERIAAYTSLPTLIPVLAAYHLGCAALLLSLRSAGPDIPAPREADPEQASGLALLKEVPYLRTIAALVILGTISASMIDYVFKAQAVAEYGRGETLLRFFAAFYSVTGVLTFLVQAGLSEFALGQLGMARTVGTLPIAVTLGGLGALAAPGLASAAVARGLEMVFRGSLFRAGYELFYAPMPNHEKRSAKSVIDVGFDRFGDAIGSGLVTLLLLVAPTAVSHYGIVTTAVLMALAGLWTASRLQGAYVDALEHGLRERGGTLPESGHLDQSLALTGFADSMTMVTPGLLMSQGAAAGSPAPAAHAVSPETAKPPPPAPSISSDPVLQQIAALRSGSATSVRAALADANRPALIPHLIQLLAWDRVSGEVIAALRAVAERHSGQLIDAMLDPASDFAIRRRIPRILAGVPTHRVALALLDGLNDRRFEVRFQCGRALAIIQGKNPSIRFEQEAVFGAVRREVAVSKPVWDSHRLLDRAEETEHSVQATNPVIGELLRDRTNRSLQHLFTLLSLTFPPDPLTIALHGLHSDDAHLRGTAIEYLESILPHDIRDRLRPLLTGQESRSRTAARPSGQVLEDLVKSNQSIVLRLDELRKSDPKPES
ncbi:MAG: Npt1/Npt2 family nucleotide transporter [Bryobacteraceae bacterium]